MTHEEARQRWAECREYKAQGNTSKEVAEHFGISMKSAKRICRGINSQHKKINQHTKTTEEERRAYVESFLPIGFSYVGGYIDCDHKVTIQCKVCGAIFDRSMASIRHSNAIICECCLEADKAEKQMREREQKEKQKAELEQQRAEARERKAEARSEWLAERLHPCPVCGTITTNQKYCSTACQRKVNNHRKELKRRAKLADAVVDADIEIHELFSRDKGVCHICGGACDWNDKEIRPTGIVCGDLYPSVDHVIPLAKGGLHEWGNVRLAHRICNSLKRDNIPLC